MAKSLKQRTARALLWSATQSWGVKLFTLLLFFVLARYVSPAELGLASVVTLVLAFVAVLSEQGFSDAIVQHKALAPADLNLPFVLSLSTALVSSCVLVFGATSIARLLGAAEAAGLIALAALIPPLTVASAFQIAMCKRDMDFKSLATASLASTVLSGVLGLLLAVAGFGALSLVVQAIAAAFLLTALVWRKPVWKPGSTLSTENFRPLFAFSSHAFAGRLLDFFSGRIVDLLILSQFGLVGIGLYTVGAKLYLTLLQLLGFTLTDVALAALSKIATDQARLRLAYLRLVFLASCTALPFFTILAALAPEARALLFGAKWAGADPIMMYLFLLGATQVIQYFNGALLNATGNARIVFLINLAKFSAGIVALTLFDAASVTEMTGHYVLSQLLVQPASFYCGMRVTGTTLRRLLKQVAPGLLSSALAFGAIALLRAQTGAAALNAFEALCVYSLAFAAVFLPLLWLSCSHKLVAGCKYIRSSYTS
jgi:O-antigen/teichoic acid export membrane protein